MPKESKWKDYRGVDNAEKIYELPIPEPKMEDNGLVLAYDNDTKSFKYVPAGGDTSTLDSRVSTVESNLGQLTSHVGTMETDLDARLDVLEAKTTADATSIQGKTVPAPTAAEDEKVLAFDNDTNSMKWVTPASGSDPALEGRVATIEEKIEPVGTKVDIGPQMQSNTLPSPYVVEGTNLYSGAYYYAFDKNTGNYVEFNSNGTLIFDWNSPKKVDSVMVTTGPDLGGMNMAPRSFSVQGSDDKVTWTTLYNNASTGWKINSTYELPLQALQRFRYYRFVVGYAVDSSTAYPRIREIQFFSIAKTYLKTNAVEIQGKSVTAPTVSDDQKVLQYDNISGAFKYAALPTVSPVRGISIHVHGALVVEAGAAAFISPVAMDITDIKLNVGTAPVGADILIDIAKNGTTMYTTTANRPKVVAGATAGTVPALPDVKSIAVGDIITININQVGTTTVGSNLTILLICRQTA